MKLTCILGSGRKDSDSTKIALKTIEEIKKNTDLEENVYNLHELNFKGCCGCGLCKTSFDYCAQEDELSPVLNEIKYSDVIILTSPIYYGHVSGQTKCFIDRTYSYLKPNFYSDPNPSRLTPNKILYYIQSQGSDEINAYDNVCDFIKDTIRASGVSNVHTIKIISTMMPDSQEAMETALKEIKEYVKKDFKK